jgi:hypothetical protein
MKKKILKVIQPPDVSNTAIIILLQSLKRRWGDEIPGKLRGKTNRAFKSFI